MQREERIPRTDWPARVEELGFYFHSIDGGVYWDERACYRFTAAEIDTLEAATAELQERCTRGGGTGDRARRLRALRDPRGVPRLDRALLEGGRQSRSSGASTSSWDGTGRAAACSSTTPTRPPRCSRRASCSGTGCRTSFRTPTSSTRSTRSSSSAGRQMLRAAARGRRACTSPATRDSREDRGNLDYLRDTAHAGRPGRARHRHRRHRLGRQALRGPGGAAHRARSSSSIPGSGWCARSSGRTSSQGTPCA